MITRMNAILEIDHERGVIYVHVKDKVDIMYRNIMTAVRISGLPTPIPKLKDRQLDIGLNFPNAAMCDWKGKDDLPDLR